MKETSLKLQLLAELVKDDKGLEFPGVIGVVTLFECVGDHVQFSCVPLWAAPDPALLCETLGTMLQCSAMPSPPLGM